MHIRHFIIRTYGLEEREREGLKIQNTRDQLVLECILVLSKERTFKWPCLVLTSSIPLYNCKYKCLK